MRVERRDVWGPITKETLRQFHLSKAFLSADAVHVTGGFMTIDESIAKMNEIVLRNASNAFVLADAEKFNRYSFIRFAALSEVGTIFTDSGIPPDLLAGFQDAGARIQVVSTRSLTARGACGTGKYDREFSPP